MRQAMALCVVLMVFTARAFADPVSPGRWSIVPLPDADFVPFYDGASFDCHGCGVAFYLGPHVEYLNDGAGGLIGFSVARFPGASVVMRMTAWSDGSLWWDPDTGAFIYDTGTGFRHDSRDGLSMALFRSIGAGSTDYWLAVEDLPVAWPDQDRDFNDIVYHWRLAIDPEPDPVPAPEPGTMLLVAGGAAALISRRRCQGPKVLRS